MSTKPYLIGVAGGSCSGKTSIAEELVRLFPPGTAAALQLDSYYRDLSGLPAEERKRTNFDRPEALEWELLAAQVRSLAEGTAIVPPAYDFKTQTRGEGTLRVEPLAAVVVEGLFALYDKSIRALLGTKVFVELEDETRFARRLVRDTRERGHSTESVKNQYDRTVRPMFEKHISPTKRFADVIVRGDDPVGRAAQAVLEHVKRYWSLNLTS